MIKSRKTILKLLLIVVFVILCIFLLYRSIKEYLPDERIGAKQSLSGLSEKEKTQILKAFEVSLSNNEEFDDFFKFNFGNGKGDFYVLQIGKCKNINHFKDSNQDLLCKAKYYNYNNFDSLFENDGVSCYYDDLEKRVFISVNYVSEETINSEAINVIYKYQLKIINLYVTMKNKE